MMSEDDVQRNVVKLLEDFGRPDVCWFAVPNGELRSPRVGKKLKECGVQRGVADLIFTIDGVVWGLELKTDKGRQSDVQTSWQEQFERAGGQYILARGLKEAIKALQRIGALRMEIKT